jgi:adenosine deaminase
VVTSAANHPLRRYFDAGIPVSLNTDDPLFFGNTLIDEMVTAQQVHGFTRDDIKRLVVSAVEMSWLTADAKANLLKQFRGMSAWNEAA